MIRLMMVMVPAVFLINGFSKHNWLEAFLFAVAVAVGLTPEMLPMIVTVNLSKGALVMARQKVVVKRLNSIQNLGGMDVLCTDKTGTITQGKIVLEKYLDVEGRSSDRVLEYGYLNSYHHTGLKNLLDEAILEHEDLEESLKAKEMFRKIDEIPFDFVRRRMSVVVEDQTGLNTLICKGALEEIMDLCSRVEIEGKVAPMQPAYRQQGFQIAHDLNAQGFRVIALAYKEMPGASDEPTYSVKDETDLILLGFLSFLDPPKDSAKETLQRLKNLKVDVKILTGDNDVITAYICSEVGLPVETILLGPQLEAMTDAELDEAVNRSHVFAKLAPAQKEHIIRALQRKGHVVGFMGDGINDAPALKAADVGISVDSAVDIAKESSDIILLENSLLILEQGVLQGRRVFGNITKYIKMAASSNFGNMFSVVGASAFLPFLPMLPIQVLTNNLLYDFSQTAIPTDEVDAGLAGQTAPVDHRRSAALHPGHRPDQLDLRLPDLLHPAVRLPRLGQPGPVSHRLVCRVALHPDSDHPRHPHQQDPLHPEPGQLAADRHLAGDRDGRRLADHLPPGQYARICRLTRPVLAAARLPAGRLRHPDPNRQNLVFPPLWRMN